MRFLRLWQSPMKNFILSVLSGPVSSRPDQVSSSGLSCPGLSCPDMSSPGLSCPDLSFPGMNSPGLSCSDLSCPSLSCPDPVSYLGWIVQTVTWWEDNYQIVRSESFASLSIVLSQTTNLYSISISLYKSQPSFFRSSDFQKISKIFQKWKISKIFQKFLSVFLKGRL